MLSRFGITQLLVCTTFLSLMGIVMVYSASALNAELSFGNAWIYAGRQLGGLMLGVAVALGLGKMPLGWIRRLAYAGLIGSTLLLVATLTPLGAESGGARRWLSIGGFVFQPLELAKLALVVALARWLADNTDRMCDWRMAVGIPMVITLIPATLLLQQPDFGGALLLAAFAGGLMFTSGARLTHLGATALPALPLAAWIAWQQSYRQDRLRGFLDPFADPLGDGYQLVQSLLAFGVGGLSGTGLGAGQQKLGYLPEAHTDFILSVVGEEIGLLGVVLVLGCFAAWGVAALGIASRARDPFSMLLATGAGLLIWAQGLVNAGVVMGVLPTKGTTLPLFSYGRSSLIVSLAAVGLVLNVARPRKRGRKGWR